MGHISMVVATSATDNDISVAFQTSEPPRIPRHIRGGSNLRTATDMSRNPWRSQKMNHHGFLDISVAVQTYEPPRICRGIRGGHKKSTAMDSLIYPWRFKPSSHHGYIL